MSTLTHSHKVKLLTGAGGSDQRIYLSPATLLVVPSTLVQVQLLTSPVHLSVLSHHYLHLYLTFMLAQSQP